MKQCYYISSKSPLGTIFIGSIDKNSISFLSFIKKDHNKYIKELLHRKYREIREELPIFKHTITELKAYFEDGRIIDSSIELRAIFGSVFERRVWEATVQISYGELASYKDIAEQINMPKAARAVGNALGKNPIAILVPCHRVIKTNGEYGNYAYGSLMKEKLIQLEQNGKVL